MSISIIARLQNPKSRCSQLDRDVFVYSFALSPEEHQPSGSCNFSRLDDCKLTFTSKVSIDNVFALNYNILRINNGLVNLRFTN